MKRAQRRWAASSSAEICSKVVPRSCLSCASRGIHWLSPPFLDLKPFSACTVYMSRAHRAACSFSPPIQSRSLRATRLLLLLAWGFHKAARLFRCCRPHRVLGAVHGAVPGLLALGHSLVRVRDAPGRVSGRLLRCALFGRHGGAACSEGLCVWVSRVRIQ